MPFLAFCLAIDSNVRPGVGKFGCILHLIGMICPWAGNLIAKFLKKVKSPPHALYLPPHRHYIDRCITFTYDLPGMTLFLYNTCKTKGGILDHAVALCNINNLAFTITRFQPKPHRCVPISSFQTTKWTIATGWRFYVHAFTLAKRSKDVSVLCRLSQNKDLITCHEKCQFKY